MVGLSAAPDISCSLLGLPNPSALLIHSVPLLAAVFVQSRGHDVICEKQKLDVEHRAHFTQHPTTDVLPAQGPEQGAVMMEVT